MSLNFRPIGDLVVIEPIGNSNQTTSSIIIPDSVKEKPNHGRVIACGKGSYKGELFVPISVKIGDEVLYKKDAGSNVKIDGVDYLFMREEGNILGILNQHQLFNVLTDVEMSDNKCFSKQKHNFEKGDLITIVFSKEHKEDNVVAEIINECVFIVEKGCGEEIQKNVCIQSKFKHKKQ